MSGLPLVGGLNFKKKKRIKKLIKQNRVLIIGITIIAICVYSIAFPRVDFYAQAYSGNIEKEEDMKLDFSLEKDDSNLNSNIKKTFFNKNEKSDFEDELYEMVDNYPIREMIPYIAKQDRIVAAFLIGIAKKESNWGKRVPTLDNTDCYNYWGYKAAGKRGVAMGHGCFSNPEEAVNVVGGRIKQLVDKNLTTPSKMVVWKCGSSCAATGGEAAARKWISDVNIYFQKISKSNV